MSTQRHSHEPPVRGRNAGHDLHALQSLLDAGWQIDQPVLVRPSWAQQRSGEVAFHVIVARNTQRSLVVLADSNELRHFLDEHAIAVA